MHALVFDELGARPTGAATVASPRVTPDTATGAALRAWGVVSAGGGGGK